MSAQIEIAPPATGQPILDSNALRGRKIFVVDDSPDNRVIVGVYLKSVGALIFEAVNGHEGAEQALAGSFDIVLMDIQMPIVDGYQAMQRLKNAGYQGLVVALTAHAFKEERDRCLSAGFDSYVTKPIERTYLIKTLSGLVKTAANSERPSD